MKTRSFDSTYLITIWATMTATCDKSTSLLENAHLIRSFSSLSALQLKYTKILNTHQTGIQSPLCYITRICLLVPSPIAAVHYYVSKACWVDVRCWFRFFWGTTIIAYYWVKVITRGYKHVFRMPAFFWYNVELNLQSKNRLISTAAFVCRRKRPVSGIPAFWESPFPKPWWYGSPL